MPATKKNKQLNADETHLKPPQLRKPVGAQAIQRGGTVAGVGKHNGVGVLALGDHLALVLRAAIRDQETMITAVRDRD